MNTHWLIVLAEIVALTGLVVLFAFWTITPARGQSVRSAGAGLPAPPAYAMAFQLLKQGRSLDAIAALREVEGSAVYQNTPYAPEAVYVIAHIYRDNLRDGARAMEAFDSLATDYGRAAFPHKQAAAAERRALGRTLDAANSRRPLYRMLDVFVTLTGRRSYSFALALGMISSLVRFALAPLTLRQMRGAREMQALQPDMKRLQEAHKNDPVKLYDEAKKLQAAHGVNPHIGWILGLAQAPIFYAMYQAVQLYQYHAGGGFLWIGSKLAAAHPQIVALDLGLPDIPLLVLYAISMYAAQSLISAADPAQAKTLRATGWIMPVVCCAWIGAHHTASAFVLYWLISNILATAVQIAASRTPARSAAATS